MDAGRGRNTATTAEPWLAEDRAVAILRHFIFGDLTLPMPRRA